MPWTVLQNVDSGARGIFFGKKFLSVERRLVLDHKLKGGRPISLAGQPISPQQLVRLVVFGSSRTSSAIFDSTQGVLGSLRLGFVVSEGALRRNQRAPSDTFDKPESKTSEHPLSRVEDSRARLRRAQDHQSHKLLRLPFKIHCTRLGYNTLLTKTAIQNISEHEYKNNRTVTYFARCCHLAVPSLVQLHDIWRGQYTRHDKNTATPVHRSLRVEARWEHLRRVLINVTPIAPVIRCPKRGKQLPGRRPRAFTSARLACSPPTKAIRVQSPAGSLDFCMWESCRTMPLAGGFSRRYPVSHTLSSIARNSATHSHNSNSTPGPEACLNIYSVGPTIWMVQRTPSCAERTRLVIEDILEINTESNTTRVCGAPVIRNCSLSCRYHTTLCPFRSLAPVEGECRDDEFDPYQPDVGARRTSCGWSSNGVRAGGGSRNTSKINRLEPPKLSLPPTHFTLNFPFLQPAEEKEIESYPFVARTKPFSFVSPLQRCCVPNHRNYQPFKEKGERGEGKNPFSSRRPGKKTFLGWRMKGGKARPRYARATETGDIGTSWGWLRWMRELCRWCGPTSLARDVGGEGGEVRKYRCRWGEREKGAYLDYPPLSCTYSAAVHTMPDEVYKNVLTFLYKKDTRVY
ncbi:hypothetical protein PR048_007889 [Dryococelus australis]|uniref:Uncharacterized protein n=1 Tax=Dryococelus australis TaxID=614101 RepID=A0ABQ9HWE2_9NEOP|nr:hypothetical protein PR048_007889 [Dryococelus australis]